MRLQAKTFCNYIILHRRDAGGYFKVQSDARSLCQLAALLRKNHSAVPVSVLELREASSFKIDEFSEKFRRGGGHRALEEGQFRKKERCNFFAFLFQYQIFSYIGTYLSTFRATLPRKTL